ncbi:POK25 protein, partial [Cochlearius cochlearius]|nr:POK25 protein [Cochlearius cochlearius]
MLKRTVSPQPIQLKLEVKPLNDVQKLARMLNWLRPYLGLTNEQMQPLLQLLKGDTDLLAP